MKQTLLVLIGAAVGGALGYFAFFWIIQQGYYALVLPGGLLGLGAGIGKCRHVLLAVFCGLCALALGLFTQWCYAPFLADESLGYFLAHIPDLKPLTLIMIALGGLVGFWIPFGRIERGPRPA